MGYSKEAVYMWGAAHMMRKEGSSFESRLADLWMFSDLKNRVKLQEAFSETFSKWNEWYERHLEIKVEAEANR